MFQTGPPLHARPVEHPLFTVSGSTPTPWSGPFRDHGLNPPLSTENPKNKGFSGSGAPIFGFGLADPAPKGVGVDPFC